MQNFGRKFLSGEVMRTTWQRIRILTFGLLLLGCGWAGPASSGAASSSGPDQGREDFRTNYDFISFFYNLINDAIDLLPDDLEKLVLQGRKGDSLLAGALAFDPQHKSLRVSLEASNLGAQASYVVLQIYGGAPVNAVIPQAVYYNGFDRGENFSERIIEGRRQIERSSHPDRDRYNLALNVLTDLWLVDLEQSGQKITDPPIEGVYLRDAHEDLYLVEEAQKRMPT
jgi:hypothetical protein